MVISGNHDLVRGCARHVSCRMKGIVRMTVPYYEWCSLRCTGQAVGLLFFRVPSAFISDDGGGWRRPMLKLPGLLIPSMEVEVALPSGSIWKSLYQSGSSINGMFRAVQKCSESWAVADRQQGNFQWYVLDLARNSSSSGCISLLRCNVMLDSDRSSPPCLGMLGDCGFWLCGGFLP